MGMRIGKHARILMKTRVVSPWKIIVGDNTVINENVFLDGRGGIEIGSNTTIAIYTRLITGYHDIDDGSFSYKKSNIMVGDNVAIFANCTVLPGAKLNKGCIISAGSVVKRGEYIEDGVYGGNPIVYIRRRNIESNKIVIEPWLPLFR